MKPICEYRSEQGGCSALGIDIQCPYVLKDVKIDYKANLNRGGYYPRIKQLTIGECKVAIPSGDLEKFLLKGLKEQLDKKMLVNLNELLTE